MSTEQTQADSSPAEAVDVFNGEEPTLAEFNQYRESGEVAARFKPAGESESATDDAQEETEESEAEEAETESDSETEETQEKLPPKATAYEKRVKQLLAEKNAATARAEEAERRLAAKQDGKTESSPEHPQYANPKPTADDKNPDGTLKYAEYEDLTEAIGRWAAKEERASWERENAEKQKSAALQTTLEEARSRYDDADEVIFPVAQAIHEAKIPLAVKEVFADSDHFIDLCYVVGSDPEELKKFIALAQSNPRAALGKVFEYERGIVEELSKASGGKEAPPERKQTSAPKPPSPVGGASSRAFDVSDESLSPEEWSRKRTADLAKKRP